MKLEFPRQILEKYSNIKFNDNNFSGSRFFCARTDRQAALSHLSVLQTHIKILFSAHMMYVRILHGYRNEVIISLYNINGFVFITGTKSVYCAVKK